MTLVSYIEEEIVTPMIALATILLRFLKLGAPCFSQEHLIVALLTCWESSSGHEGSVHQA